MGSYGKMLKEEEIKWLNKRWIKYVNIETVYDGKVIFRCKRLLQKEVELQVDKIFQRYYRKIRHVKKESRKAMHVIGMVTSISRWKWKNKCFNITKITM